MLEPAILDGMTTPESPRVIAVCRVHEPRADGTTGRHTAIDKRPIDGPARVGTLGVHGDTQLDTRHHGGPDAALYAYPSEGLRHWADELGRELAPGTFGENLTTSGVDIAAAPSGQRWLVGDLDDADHVVVEVTDPRIPCQTFARWLDEPHWVKRFAAHGESGTYLRVLKSGSIRAGDAITVIAQGEGPSIGEQFARTMNNG